MVKRICTIDNREAWHVMMSFKQQEVLENIVSKLQERFPEVKLVGVEEINAHSFWVNIIEPKDEDRQLELSDLQAELGTDALLEYGVNFHFMPAHIEEILAG
jgi:hypothetical protein